jgi:hypothetical protein
MSETVYVFGAGVNRSIKDYQQLKPPLATDLFRQALRHEMLGAAGREELEELFAYIQKYWKLSTEDLKEEPYDLEACFTLLQQQRLEAAADADPGREEEVARVEDQLSSLLTRFLGHIEPFSATDLALPEVGRRVLEERAAVLTFNYDTIIESAIESVAGDSGEPPPEEGQVPDERLSYSDYKWNRALAYGVRFDEVHLQQTKAVLEPVEGDRFYNYPRNELYPVPILKLHGSLNWFVHTSRRDYPNPHGLNNNPKEGRIVLASGYPHIRSGFGRAEDPQGWILRPLIVTPVLYKDLGGKGPVGQSWRRAREELSDCRRLVVAGYSCPPTDFAMRRLFLEAFVDGPPKDLVSVNPDRGVAGAVASLCHFGKRPIVRESIEEFLDYP